MTKAMPITDLGTVVNVAHTLAPWYSRVRRRVLTVAYGETERKHRAVYWTQPHSTNSSRPFVFVGRGASKHREFLVAVELVSRDPLVAVFTTEPDEDANGTEIARYVKLTTLEMEVLTALREHVENEMNGWGDVYLDNALLQGASGRARRGALGSLEQKGLYRPYGDGFYGRVLLPSGNKQS